MTILALDPQRRTNAQAIRDAHLLGYIRDEDYVLDVTYNEGKFWRQWQPKGLVTNDLDPRYGLYGDDWRNLHWEDATFDVVVFDPDYKLQGTSSNQGPASSNAAYGMDREYRPVGEQLALIQNGLFECLRVCKPGGMILLKTMDQVVSGEKNWLTKDFWRVLDNPDGARLVDEIHVYGHRAQPKDRKCPKCDGIGYHRCADPNCTVEHCAACLDCECSGRIPIRQVHTHGSFSTLQIYEKGKS